MMTSGELRAVGVIERKTREAACILMNYSHTKLSAKKKEVLKWVYLRVASVCRELFHNYTQTHSILTKVERPLFLNEAERYFDGNSFSILFVLDMIQQELILSALADRYVTVLVDYLNNIEGECMAAEATGILPKEESWDSVP